MSRAYEMNVEIYNYDISRQRDIQEALDKEWGWGSDWWARDREIDGKTWTALANYGQGQLAGGESEEEFADRIAKAAWKANGKFCNVEVRTIYMEDLPYEDYSFNEDHYKEMMEKNDGQQGDSEGDRE